MWTTPLFEQVRTMACGDEPRAPLHGYWTSDFKRINPRWMNDPSEKRLFSRDDTTFDHLLEDMRGRDMSFILDIVCNHSSPQTEDGKGKLYDDGKLIADFDHDEAHWYHHYGPTLDWDDEWQVQNGELAGLATFNENNILFRNHIKEALTLWVQKGVDALRIDTVKHMPLWFWQELMADMAVVNPSLFRFGEWINAHPENERSVEFANQSGMSILDFGFCHAVREALGKHSEGGFHELQKILDLDGKYHGATELVTFFENHDMPRLQSIGASDRDLELALILLITSRGVPCLYYGCEQYLHDDTDGGDDPYNRPMMAHWEPTEAIRLIGILAGERHDNQAIQWGGQWPKFVDADCYVFLRRYRDSRCLVFINKGPARELEVDNLEFPDGEHACLLDGSKIGIRNGVATIQFPEQSAHVFAVRGEVVDSKVIVRLQVNGAPTQPGDRLAVIGDCPELGNWDLREAYELECVNSNTWFGEVPFDTSAGHPVGYKYVIFSPDENAGPQRENRLARRRLLIPEGCAKWRDRWEQ
ncbi:alpha-amylase family glycosyl hydrolase [Luteolibacter sp. Populi]|uniref:alpha-amylase family glycosyl hydrolase n=1 Tax=Luteolibacter sp. Populi TaxID=3230487 RepID=UPI003465BB7C